MQRATDQITRLVRDELTMARAEMTAKGKRAGIGAGLLGGGVMLGIFAGATAVATIVLTLAAIMPDAVATLIAQTTGKAESTLITSARAATTKSAAWFARNPCQSSPPPALRQPSRSLPTAVASSGRQFG
ncbi:phage holin family protein [Micromonospora noduli]|uniref:phage holin family protein n=1 Tax=Micromonospora noduli TaxID=709876 RepID=UPI0035A226CA